MADFWLYREGGTRAFGDGIFSAVGAEPTQAEWNISDNCFDSGADALVEPWRIIATAVGDGETVMFYDEADGVTVTTHSIDNGTTTSASTAGTINITSRSSNPALCKLSPKTNVTCMMIHNQAATAVDYNYTGIGFVGNGSDFTKDTHPAFLQFQNACGDVVIDNCTFGDINLAPTGDNQWGMIYCVDARTVTLNDCEWKNITSETDSTLTVWGFHNKAGSTVNITGTLSVHDITISAGVQLRAGFKLDGTANISGTVTAEDITVTTSSDVGIIGALFTTAKAAAIINVTGSITANRLTHTGGNASATVLSIYGAHNINNIYASDITVTKGVHASANGRGGVILLQTDDAIGTINNVTANNVNVWAGAVVYYSNGAGGAEVSAGVTQSFCANVRATNCSAGENGGGLYKGGDGSVTFRGIYIDSCDCTGIGGGGTGGGFYGMYADRSVQNGRAAQDCTIVLENVTVTNCTAANGGDSAHMPASDDGTASILHTYLKNCVLESTVAGHLLLTEPAAVNDSHICAITNCNITDASGSGINDAGLNTSATQTNVTEGDALLDASGYPAKNSPLVGAGYKYWTGVNPIGTDGEPFSDWDTDIGSIQSTWSAFHPKNL